MSIVLWEDEITGCKGPKAMSLDSSEEKINYKCNGFFFSNGHPIAVFLNIFLSYEQVRA